MKVFDAHIHLFEKPYGQVFDHSYIKDGPAGELFMYEQYRRLFDVEGAFVICYAEDASANNNSYVESIKAGREWIHSFGYIKPNHETMHRAAVDLNGRGHFGLSCYPRAGDDAQWLASPAMYPFWDYLAERQMPISFNVKAFQCRSFAKVLERRPDVIIIVSHMAAPKVVDGVLDEADYASLLALGGYPGVYVKLSGFYAFSKEGWRYPQADLFRVVDRLREAFGTKRLVFASDFSPVTEYNTYRQALELLRTEYDRLTPQELEDIYYNNARGIVKKRK